MTTQTESDNTPAKPGIGAVLAGATAYVVLKQVSVSTGAAWETVNTAASYKSGEAAIRSVVAKLSEADQAGVFVAVPTRSWKPVRVKAKVETTLLIEDVKP